MQRLDSLDGLRGVLALSVALYHFTETRLFPGAYIAVDMFFIMSGFILCHAYGPKFERYDVRTFLHRRIARLMPVYLITGLAILPMVILQYPLDPAYTNLHPSHYSMSSFLAYMGALQIVVPGFYWNTPGWSVSGELWLSLGVFICLPWVMRVRTGGWQCVFFSLALYVLIIASNGNLSIIAGTVGGVPGAVLRPLAGFVMGAGIFKLLRSRKPSASSLGKTRVVEVCLVLICFGIQAVLGRSSLDLLVIAAFAAFLFVLVSKDDRPFIGRLLICRPILFLGMISYSVYLWHTIVKHFFFRGVRDGWLEIGVVEIGIYLATVIAVSYLSFLTIERPGQNSLNSWFRRNSALLPSARA